MTYAKSRIKFNTLNTFNNVERKVGYMDYMRLNPERQGCSISILSRLAITDECLHTLLLKSIHART